MPDGDVFTYKIDDQRPLTLPSYELWGRSNLIMVAMFAAEGIVAMLARVPVVHEYPKVFPEDLPGLLPIREIEFYIDLVSGTT